MIDADVVIVGGGIMGCSTALHLVKASKCRVALVERGLCGSQASAANFGNVRCQGRPLSQMPLSLRSREIWWRLAELLGEDCEYERTGALKTAFRDADLAELEEYSNEARGAFGLNTEILGRNALRAKFPWMSDKAVGARYSPDDGVANPRLVAAAFGRAARAAGVNVYENYRVTAVIKAGNRFEVHGDGQPTIGAPQLVNAAGAWGNAIAEMFGEKVPMEALGPQMGVTEPLPYFIVPSTSTVNSPIYFRQVRRGNVVFGGGPRAVASAESVRHYSRPENTVRQAGLLAEVAPALKSARIVRAWSGIEGYTKDKLQIMGPSETTPGLFHAFGFSGSGFQLGPGVGAVMSDLLLTGKTDTPIDAFSVGRFRIDKAKAAATA